MSSIHDSALKEFFECRAAVIHSAPTMSDLCYASGRDPRLWQDGVLYQDMIESITSQLELTTQHNLLEVGCAAGFLAQGLAPTCSHYTGIDLARTAIQRARSLSLTNATFRQADATRLPFPNGTFDRAVSYDVFTNFNDSEQIHQIVSEMARVVKPAGKILIGSIPDASRQVEYASVVNATSLRLDAQHGKPALPTRRPSLRERVRTWARSVRDKPAPQVTCYYFTKEQFTQLAANLDLQITFRDIHPLNPYLGFRFNVVLCSRGTTTAC